MNEPSGTNQEVIEEYASLKQRIKELKKSEIEFKRLDVLLKKAEKDLRLILDSTPSMIWQKDPEGTYLQVNKAYCDTVGLSEDSILGKTDHDLFPADIADKYVSHDRKILKSGISESGMEEYHLKPSGEYGWSRTDKMIYHDANGRIGGTIGFATDITEHKRAEEALRESEELYRNVFNNHTAVKLLIDPDTGNIIEANDAAVNYYGWSQERFKQMKIQEINTLPPEEVKAEMERARNKNKTHFEFRHRRADGSIRDVEVFSSKIQVKGKNLLHSIIHDITERKKAEIAVEQERASAVKTAEEIAIIAEIGKVISSTLDTDEVYEKFASEVKKLIPFDRIVMSLINPGETNIRTVAYVSGIDVSGRRKGDSLLLAGSMNEEVIRTRHSVIVQSMHGEEMVARFSSLDSATQAGIRSHMCIPLIIRSKLVGTLIFQSIKENAYTEQVLIKAQMIGGQIVGSIANAQLFTELKNAEASLRDSEERYRTLYTRASDGIFLLSGDGKVVDVNESFARMHGYRQQELLHMSLRDLDTPETFQLAPERMRRIWDGEALTFEVEHYHKDGHVFPLEVSASLITAGGESYVQCFHRDITDSKRIEEEKRSLEEQLHRAEKMEALGQLAGGVAHDLNNVLGILSGYSELLLEEIPEGSRSKGYVEKILQSTEKGAAIIQDLLTLARRGVTVSDVINLNSVVSGFFKTPVFERMKDYHPRATFKTECEKNLLNIKGSPVHLEKTLMNLVSNAAEAIPGEGTVTIRTENRYLDKPIRGYDEVKQGDYVVLTVSDTGMGIPAENREKIFEPFYTKKTMGRSGTGLGLAIVWGTVKDHNGYIDLQTEVGEGTTFTLYFPVTREELAAQQQKQPMALYMGQGESVLVVDDIAEQRDVATGLLTHMGYEVHAVSSGEEAVEYLKRKTVDILVLDMIMAPGIDGLETYRRVIEINPQQKAILVSGFSQTDRVKEAQKLGAGAYVKKPYAMEKIGVAIRDELNR